MDSGDPRFLDGLSVLFGWAQQAIKEGQLDGVDAARNAEIHPSKNTREELDWLKVAVATDDGRTVSQDLASARFLMILTLDRAGCSGREVRLKPRRLESKWEPPRKEAPKGMVREITALLKDCHMLVAGGMEARERQEIVAAGKKTVVTDLVFMDDVVAALEEGTLDDHSERLR
jgi:hypothetical protein